MIDYVDYVFCLTGHSSSREQSLGEETVRMSLSAQGKTFFIAGLACCNLYMSRNGCMQRQGFRKHQKPFEGLIKDYGRLIWIDSDNIINSDQVMRLLSHDVDIVAGWYRSNVARNADGLNGCNKSSCGMWINESRCLGESYLVNEIAGLPRNDKGLVPVDYSGMGLMIVKKGVFEALTYPWFDGRAVEWTEEIGDELVEMACVESDDGCFCRKAKEAGFQTYIDPEVWIGHDKQVIV
jgi:hypothetical protein